VSLRRIACALALLLCAAVPAPGAADVRTATPRDNGAHPGEGARTEWWFVSALDPDQDFAVAAAIGSEFPGSPAATVVFLYLPDGSVHTIARPRELETSPAQDDVDVRLGPDRLHRTAPGVYRLSIDMPEGFPLHGGPAGPVRVDLTLRATAPGFTAGPLVLPEGQDLSWTVAAPSARVSGVVEVDGRRYELDDAPGYHDHNYGQFDLADDAHGGWDWSQVHLPGGRSLVTGIVRPSDPSLRDGVAVLSGPGGRLGEARAEDVTVRRGRWSRVGALYYPRDLTLRARLSGGWSIRVRYRALRAAPLSFSLDGSSALVEIESRASGELMRGGRVVSRWTAAPGFYEYESTPITRQRDAVPGSAAWAGGLTRSAARALQAAV
jgi:hypothetical protein